MSLRADEVGVAIQTVLAKAMCRDDIFSFANIFDS